MSEVEVERVCLGGEIFMLVFRVFLFMDKQGE